LAKSFVTRPRYCLCCWLMAWCVECARFR
jgi:hypothetical protein